MLEHGSDIPRIEGPVVSSMPLGVDDRIEALRIHGAQNLMDPKDGNVDLLDFRAQYGTLSQRVIVRRKGLQGFRDLSQAVLSTPLVNGTADILNTESVAKSSSRQNHW